ncbi:MAG: beta-galactosidase [Eubacteriales bacterium]|nr:beta-galactosidase [Eubacteriales bacterium]
MHIWYGVLYFTFFGCYDFSFFDHVIAKAQEKGLKAIMGTPTATIPAWLAKKEPSLCAARGRKNIWSELISQMYGNYIRLMV